MRAGARTVQLHEGIERPILGIIALFMPVGLTKRPGLEVSSVLELGVIPDLGSPLIKKESKSGSSPQIPGKTVEHERRQRYSHIPMPRNREHAATSLARTTAHR
jgi:hypothetical protein